MRINLIDYSGEFCTSRKTKGLDQVIEKIKSALDQKMKIEISTVGVKILTPSYIDELVPPLSKLYDTDFLLESVIFNPPLEGFLLEQVTRGIANRKQT